MLLRVSPSISAIFRTSLGLCVRRMKCPSYAFNTPERCVNPHALTKEESFAGLNAMPSPSSIGMVGQMEQMPFRGMETRPCSLGRPWPQTPAAGIVPWL